MRYIITQSQLHKLVYSYLDEQFSNEDFRRETNEYDKSGNTWRIRMFDNNGNEKISYFWFGPGEDDEGNPHNGVGSIHVHPDIADFIRNTFSIREGKAVDIIADWVSEKFNVDIDEIDVYPNRKSPPNY
jgi:hypothetical protein